MINRLERLALQRRLRIGGQRRVILKLLDRATGPLTAQELYRSSVESQQPVSLSTVQRTFQLLSAVGLLRRLETKGRASRYEKVHGKQRELLIDTATGDRVEFRSEGIEGLLKYAIEQLGYRLLDYHLELYGLPEAASPRADADLSTHAPALKPMSLRSRRRKGN